MQAAEPEPDTSKRAQQWQVGTCAKHGDPGESKAALTIGTVCTIDLSSMEPPRVKLLHADGQVSEWVSTSALSPASSGDVAHLAEAAATAKRTQHEHARAQKAAATLVTHAAHVSVRVGAHVARRQRALADEVNEADQAKLESKHAVERATQLTECSPNGVVKGPRYFWASVVSMSGARPQNLGVENKNAFPGVI